MPDFQPRRAPSRRAQDRPLSRLTRYGVVPLLLVAVGIRIGMYVERERAAGLAPVLPAAPRPAPAPSPVPAAVVSTVPSFELAASFDNNLFPSLLLSFGTSYPEYSRCLTVDLHNLPTAGSLQLRIESPLLERAVLVSFSAAGGQATLNPSFLGTSSSSGVRRRFSRRPLSARSS
jgi:hypothetical protein